MQPPISIGLLVMVCQAYAGESVATLARPGKISSFWNGSWRTAVVEFRRDVEPVEARRIAFDHRLDVREVRGMARYHLLIAGDPADVRRLAEREEVARVFPASQSMERGDDQIYCSQAIAGSIGVVRPERFAAGPAGSKNIFMGALNSAGLFSGWSAMGTWTAP